MPTINLTFMSGPDDGLTKSFTASDGPSFISIGRLESATIPLPTDPEASRQHARISYRDGAWLIEDLGSANGTFMGEFAQSRQIKSPEMLSPGQIFRVGLTRIKVENENQTQSYRLANVVHA
jgi:pSer/pThr/pTyr-binding forkhead associated (FHA) protein